MPNLKDTFDQILTAVRNACLEHYGTRLQSLALFGSVARGTMRPDSDIDLVLVVDPLPDGRMARMDEFTAVEKQAETVLRNAQARGIYTSLSPVFKTPTELGNGSWLFLDMTDQARILFDRDTLLANHLKQLSRRLEEMGATRVYKGGGYYWLLKPDLKPGEDFRL